MNRFIEVFFTIYLAMAFPALVCLITGIVLVFRRPKTGKWLLIAVGIYLLVGAGVCGSLFLG